MTRDTGQVEIAQGRRITPVLRRLSWIHFKLCLATWGLAMMFVPPAPVMAQLGPVLHFIWTSLTVIGSLTGVVGICVSFSKKPEIVIRRAVPIELVGLCLLLLGPLLYFITQVGLLFNDWTAGFQDRFALTIFAWTMVAAVIARLCTVLPRFHKELL